MSTSTTTNNNTNTTTSTKQKKKGNSSKSNQNNNNTTSPSGYNYHLHQRAASAERNGGIDGHRNQHQHHHTPPPTTHNFRISLAKLLGNNVHNNSRISPNSSYIPPKNSGKAPNNNDGDGDNNNNNNNDNDNDDEASRVVEALFPDASFTIPSPMMILQMERDKLEQQEERKLAKPNTIGRRGSFNVAGDFAADATSSARRRRRSSISPPNAANSAVDASSPENDVSKTPAVRRRSSVGSLIMSSTDDLVGVSRPKFRRDSDAGNDGDDVLSSSARRRRRSSLQSAKSTFSTSPPTRRRSTSATIGGRRKNNSGTGNNSPSSLQISTAKHLSITEDSTRWGSEDLEVLRLLLRTIQTAHGASASKRLLPSTGIAARVLLHGTAMQQLASSANSIRTRITLGNLRNVLSSQSNFDHVRINSPRSVTVVLRNGMQCDEVIEQVSDMLNNRSPSQQMMMETKQLMAKLEYEYRSLCDTISRRDAIEFLRAPTVPEEACQPTRSEANMNYIEATKRRGMMKLSRHQQETERLWQMEQERIQKEKMVEERLKRRQEELEARKQRARIQHSMNDLERNKPIVSYKKKHLKNDDDDTDDDDDDSDDSSDFSSEDGGRRNPYETEMMRRARKDEKRRQRLVNARETSPYGRKRKSSASSSSNRKNISTTEKVAKVRAAREAIEREKLIKAHQAEAFRAEQIRECEDRKQQRFHNIAQGRASHNAHVRQAVNATKRSYEFEKIRRIADIENEEARMMIRKEQQHRMRERLRDQLRVAQHLDLEARDVIRQGSVTLRQSLERLRTCATEEVQHHHYDGNPHRSALAGHFAKEETQNTMSRIAQMEAKLERKWQRM